MLVPSVNKHITEIIYYFCDGCLFFLFLAGKTRKLCKLAMQLQNLLYLEYVHFSIQTWIPFSSASINACYKKGTRHHVISVLRLYTCVHVSCIWLWFNCSWVFWFANWLIAHARLSQNLLMLGSDGFEKQFFRFRTTVKVILHWMHGMWLKIFAVTILLHVNATCTCTYRNVHVLGSTSCGEVLP